MNKNRLPKQFNKQKNRRIIFGDITDDFMSNKQRLENQQVCDISFEENPFHGLVIILTTRRG